MAGFIFSIFDLGQIVYQWPVLYAICSVIVISGEAMIIIYIGKYAPKDRAINKIILVDQVSKLWPNISTPQLFPTPRPPAYSQMHTLQEVGNNDFIPN